jgi:hypothetical protein
VNWSFNIFPLLKPALSNIYEKISGKVESHAKVFMSKGVIDDLDWFISNAKLSDGIHVFDNVDWNIDQADIIDGCMSRLGFYFEHSHEAFQSLLPHSLPKDTIFYFETLVIISIVEAVTHMTVIPACLVVFSDNTNAIDIFHSLRCKPTYNDLLKFAVSILLKHGIPLHVIHVHRTDNVIADLLSWFENVQALATYLGLSISSFEPP